MRELRLLKRCWFPSLFHQTPSHPVVMRTPLIDSDVLVGSQYLFDSESEENIPDPFQY